MDSVVGAPGLKSTGSIVTVHRLSCSAACEIFLDQGLNLCLPHWQVDSLPLNHQGSPRKILFEGILAHWGKRLMQLGRRL